MRRRWPLALLAALAGAVVWAAAIEPYHVGLHELTVPLAGLPAPFEGYRILHISDFESGTPGTRESQVSAIARRARPDLVAVTGDLVDKDLSRSDRIAAFRRMASWLGTLRAPDGVWFVQGHGERNAWIDLEDMDAALAGAGVRPLWDDLAVVRRGGATLAVAGVKVRDYGAQGAWRHGSGWARAGPTQRAHVLELGGPPGGAELRGRMRASTEADSIGVVARSTLGEGGDRFYLAVRRPDQVFLAASARGTIYARGELRRSPVHAGRWHRFRVRVDGETEARLRGKVWPEGEPEPEAWSLDYVDEGPGRIPSGRLGLYARGPGMKEFEDLEADGARADAWREALPSDAVSALAAKAPPGAPILLLSHTPDVFPDAARAGMGLVLAGHTQGGQVRLPFIGALATFTRLGRGYAQGVFAAGGTTLFVNRGVGTSRLPIRFLSPPEAALIVLEGA